VRSRIPRRRRVNASFDEDAIVEHRCINIDDDDPQRGEV
jgi:hypothetical protein